MEYNELKIKSQLQRISGTLIMNGGFLDNPGLYTGEMGLVLFFFRYDRLLKNESCQDYSFELFERIQKRINNETPINYKQGLTGIGSAIEYLVQRGYIEADTDDVLENFDKRIFDHNNFPYLSMEEIISIWCYANWRMLGSSFKKDLIRKTLLPPIENILRDNSIIPEWGQLNNNQSATFKKETMTLEQTFYKLDLGIENGLAGLGMNLLTELDGDVSWRLLFPNDLISIKNESVPV